RRPQGGRVAQLEPRDRRHGRMLRRDHHGDRRRPEGARRAAGGGPDAM
ncbi:MAG: hypothetical protein AVDCRST_MAG30-3276, partial [uncultured Solirubrobacteraceae bacterium]